MSGIPYYNQSAPFWDFVANLEEQGRSHPFFAGNNRESGEESDNEQRRPNPWSDGWTGFPFGPLPHRGRHGGPGRHHQPPPPPPPGDHPMGPPPPGYEEHSGEDEVPTQKDHDPQEGPSSPSEGRAGPHHRCGGRHGRHAHGGPGGSGVHHGPGRRGWGRGRGGFGGRGGHGGPFGHQPPAFGPMGGFGALAEMFQSQLFGDNNTTNNTTNEKNDDFKPEVDVFDTNEGFIVHVSLPGAKKEDVGVNWDAEKSELAIAGVIYRPADEEQLKSLALDERKVGAFDRKVRLGSRANPAQVDADAISAKLEDGILRVDVPKMDSGYVEIKKVDIE